MKTIDEFIKQVSLVMTDTIDQDEFCYVDFDLKNYEVNKENSISLLKLLKYFNKLYLLFKKDQEQLEKLNLGATVEVIRYTKSNSFRNMVLYVEKPIMCEYDSMFICMSERDDQVSSFLTNLKFSFEKNYYRKTIDIDKHIVKKFLDIFEKHIEFIELYYYLKNQLIFGDATTTLGSSIEGDTIHHLNKVQMHVGNHYFNYEDFITIDAQLGDELKINYDNCEIILESQNLPIESKMIDNVLNNTYFNKRYLKKR